VFAAGEPADVKVALTDMSSAMSGWHGRGMMGWGGQGQQGQGNNWGPGMMGWSRPGQGGNSGPGMMGPGMMGMAVRIDHDTVKAGQVRFDVTNWSRGMIHEMMIVAVDNPQAPLPYDYTQTKVAEDQVKVLGDTENLQPNASKSLEVTLAPGTYLLICNVPGHYAAGMVTPLSVTQ
jgi:uncharacterized cupredoxin-like copper-binding protein